MKKECAVLLLSVLAFSGPAQDTAVTAARRPLPLDSGYIDTQKLAVRVSPRGTYAAARQAILNARDSLARNRGTLLRKGTFYSIAGTRLEEGLVNGLAPFWYGTPWNFFGYSSVPKQGTIACGYFVSTLLLHCGFNLNRYTLAQQSPGNEARSLQTDDSVQYYPSPFDSFAVEFRKRNREGLYFAGLDFHVGFLLYRAGELLFIHSSYMDPLCAVVEKASASEPFNATTAYRIASLSNNRRLIDKWILGGRVRIRTE